MNPPGSNLANGAVCHTIVFKVGRVIERGRWLKPKNVTSIDSVLYVNLCGKHDIEDEHHILIKCPHFMEQRKTISTDILRSVYCKTSMFKQTSAI